MAERVIILGGGVAGLSTAHELVERGFEVDVYERHASLAGGKAKSIPVPGSGTGGRRDLPGEHGFRIIPSFYQHLPDTMRRIPGPNGVGTVYDRLVHAERNLLSPMARAGLPFVPGFPKCIEDVRVMRRTLDETFRLGLTADDFDHYLQRFWRVLTSCEGRRLREYEAQSWWSFVDAERRSPAYRQMLARGPTEVFVACRAEQASARVVGEIASQLLLDTLTPGRSSDRLLDGPTNEVWIDPWLAYLKRCGARYHFGATVLGLELEHGRIAAARVRVGDRVERVTGACFVAAMPVEVMSRLLTPKLVDAAPSLAGIRELAKHVGWMNGLQLFLRRDVRLTRGHLTLTEAPWALTAISQQQFWPEVRLAERGDGRAAGVVSVDISNWGTPGILYGRAARDCTPSEIAEEVWEQLKRSVNVQGAELLRDDDLHSWFLDPAIRPSTAGPHRMENDEPMHLNVAGAWRHRPDAATEIPNLFLASDYVRTHTVLASMEAANEAARRAVNGVLDATRSRARRCGVWRLREPALLAPLRWYDGIRFANGLPWDGRLDVLRRWIGAAIRTAQRTVAGAAPATAAATRAAAPETAKPIVSRPRPPERAPRAWPARPAAP